MKRTPLKRKTRLRSLSKKRRKINEEYLRLRAEFLKAHPYCQWFEAENDIDRRVMINGFAFVPLSQEIHHRRGRGKYLCDTSTWMAVSRNAHRWIHDHPKESYQKGYLLPRNGNG